MPEMLHRQLADIGCSPSPAPLAAPERETDALAAGVTAVILAGGKSSRMKSNKALLPYRGERLVERIFRQMAAIFPEVLLVTNSPETYRFIPCRSVPDHYPGMGALAGIQAGLAASSTPSIFVVACDMPELDRELIRHLLSRGAGADVVIPQSGSGLEPLHALYSKGCLTAMNRALSAGKCRIVDCFEELKVEVVPHEEIAAIDPFFRSFRNINTPEEYFRIRREEQHGR